MTHFPTYWKKTDTWKSESTFIEAQLQDLRGEPGANYVVKFMARVNLNPRSRFYKHVVLMYASDRVGGFTFKRSEVYSITRYVREFSREFRVWARRRYKPELYPKPEVVLRTLEDWAN